MAESGSSAEDRPSAEDHEPKTPQAEPPSPAGNQDWQTGWNLFVQNINGAISASDVVLGISQAPAGSQTLLYGRISHAEIARVTQAYAEPPCHAEALAVLRDDRVILLTGAQGSGRRAAAITMLDTVKSASKPLVGLAPGTTLDQLAGRSFDEGVGYLIADMLDTEMAPETAEFHWDNACRKVREARAYLVVTTGTGTRIAQATSVRNFPWQRPEAPAVLRAHLGAVMVEDTVIDEVAQALSPKLSLARIVETARRLATMKADQIPDLIAGLAHDDLQEVADWLDKTDAEIPAVLEVAALAFAAGVSERRFEEELRRLKGRIADFTTEVDPEERNTREEIDLRFRQLRKLRSDHPLIDIRLVPVARTSGSIAVRHVNFTLSTYQAHLIAGLWQRLDSDFWAGIRTWLHDLAAEGQPDLMSAAATGLAYLALQAPDEVIESYLDPWTAEDANWPEQMMAVYVVWRMSAIDELATLALQIAMHWATQGTRTQRRIATYAFSGQLGIRFPVDAVRRLTHLAEQGEPLAGNAHALLFAMLADQGDAAALILRELQRRMNRRQDLPSSDRLHDNVTYLLSIRDPRSGRPAVAQFLLSNPDRAEDLAMPWARTLCLRPWRERAIIALLNTLGAVENGPRNQEGQRDPEPLARSLGIAIGGALPPDERIRLHADMLNRNDRAGHRDHSQVNGTPRSDDQAQDDEASDNAQVARDSVQSKVSRELLETFLDACVNVNQRELG